jgi:hypothetical protein
VLQGGESEADYVFSLSILSLSDPYSIVYNIFIEALKRFAQVWPKHGQEQSQRLEGGTIGAEK